MFAKRLGRAMTLSKRPHQVVSAAAAPAEANKEPALTTLLYTGGFAGLSRQNRGNFGGLLIPPGRAIGNIERTKCALDPEGEAGYAVQKPWQRAESPAQIRGFTGKKSRFTLHKVGFYHRLRDAERVNLTLSSIPFQWSIL